MMKKMITLLVTCLVSISVSFSQESLIYHTIKTDAAKNILPWYNPDPGISYDHVLNLVWNFWDTMRMDVNGIPYYMNHQVWWQKVNDPRGIGGDQLAMALSSWKLLYAYTGNERIRENMKFIADYYLTHGFSPSDAEWADIPYPYNTLVYSGSYDGDMIIGKNYTQPDKAGSFGIELLHLYKMNHAERYPNITDDAYLDAAVKIANTLARHTIDGDENNSPMPFKVNAITGKIGALKDNNNDKDVSLSSYTTNWSGTLELFLELRQLNVGEGALYKQAFDKIISWMRKYPLQNNKWGPFFEDVTGWSDTQINAITFAQFMMTHHEYFPEWKTEVRKIIDWVYQKLGNEKWKKYGVVVVNEQTAYQQPGNSHTSRQASAELQYMVLTGDRFHYDNAVRQLNWATYMVDTDGKNLYPNDDIWLTDGYGDYVRHYLRAMAVAPELSPAENHVLSSTSLIQHAFYKVQPGKYYFPAIKNAAATEMHYTVYDTAGTEIIRLTKKPAGVLFDNMAAKENEKMNGYSWRPLKQGGVLTIQRTNARQITILR